MPGEEVKGEVGGGGGSLQSTGQLGDIMKESTEIAYTFAKVRVIHSHSMYTTL